MKEVFIQGAFKKIQEMKLEELLKVVCWVADVRYGGFVSFAKEGSGVEKNWSAFFISKDKIIKAVKDISLIQVLRNLLENEKELPYIENATNQVSLESLNR